MHRIVTAVAVALVWSAPLFAAPTDPTAPAHAPAVLGRVTASGTHAVVVQAVEGATVRLAVGSWTVKPRVIVPGDRVRIEYRPMENGDQLAQRITPVERGSSDWALLDEAIVDVETTSGGGPRASQAHATTPAAPAANSSADALPALFALFVITGCVTAGLWVVRRVLLRFDGGQHRGTTGGVPRDALSSHRRAS